MSKRNTDDAILDAAREAVLDLGVRRTTVAEIARRTGLSRPTIYRHFPDVDACVSALMTREFGALIGAALGDAEPAPHARARLVGSTVLIVERLVAHPLFVRVLDVDPQLLLPYLTDRFGGTQRAGIELFRGLVEEGQADGSLRTGDPELLSRCLVLVVQPFVISSGVIGREVPYPTVLAELRRLLDAYLRPDAAEEASA